MATTGDFTLAIDTQDAIAEIRHLTSVRYEWVLEGDITACFDEIVRHEAPVNRVEMKGLRRRAVAAAR